MIKRNQKFFNITLHIIDIFFVIASMCISYFVRFVVFSEFNNVGTRLYFPAYILPILILLILSQAFYYLYKVYTPQRRNKLAIEVVNIVKANFISVGLLLVFFYSIKLHYYSRLVILGYFVINCCLTSFFRIALRTALKYMRAKGFNIKYILVVGTGNTSKKFISSVKRNKQFGYELYGCLSVDDKHCNSFNDVKVLGNLNCLKEILEKRIVDEVVIAIEYHQFENFKYIVDSCEFCGIKVSSIPAFFSYSQSKPQFDYFDDIPLLSYRNNPLSILCYSLIKRTVDILGSIFALVVFSPVFLATYVALKLSSDEEVIFRQERLGLNCKPFIIYKFRTMVSSKNEDWTVQNDARRTKLGSFLRRYSIDEIPQFWNVLKGDMSLVGPRPEIKKYVDIFQETIPKYMVKHQVRPGITGVSQINGFRGDTSIEERINRDIYYIENWSLWLDFKILLKTVFGAFYNSQE